MGNVTHSDEMFTSSTQWRKHSGAMCLDLLKHTLSSESTKSASSDKSRGGVMDKKMISSSTGWVVGVLSGIGMRMLRF